MQRLAKYNLTKSEMLMIFNWRPSGKYHPILLRPSSIFLGLRFHSPFRPPLLNRDPADSILAVPDAMALDVIVEEADARFSEDEQAEILQAIGDTLGHEEAADGDADGDEEMGDAGEDGGEGGHNVKEEGGEDEEAVM